MRKRHVSNNHKSGQPVVGMPIQKALEQAAPKVRSLMDYRPGGKGVVHQKIAVAIRYKPVAWGFPLDEIMFSKFFQNALGLSIMPWDDIITTTSTYLPEARNFIHNGFLTSEVDWLIMLDSDVLPPLNFADRLLNDAKQQGIKMIGGWYKKKNKQAQPVVYDFSHVDEKGVRQYNLRAAPGQGIEKVDAAGAGCWLMHKDVAKALGENPYDLQHGGEDLDICWKVQQLGFGTYIDWNVACAHAGVFYV